MSFSSNELNLSGGSSTHLNASYSALGSNPGSPGSNASLGNRSVLKELNSNESNSMLPSKAALSNSKLLSTSVSNTQLNSSKISTTAAGTASTTIFENNFSQHKFHIDPELESVVISNDHKQQQQRRETLLHSAEKNQLNNSGVNKSSNKFVGLTEFDEAKIPELPDDLNPNIEEQYNLTFEECLIPTLNAQQRTTVPEGFKVDKTHLLLPTETDTTLSDNDTFADCDDDKDPLAATFSEAASLDVTTDLESFQSAGNNSFNSTFNNTMENIADVTMEAVGQPLQNIKQMQMVEQQQTDHIQPQLESMDEDEPMDIDMNETLEIIHNTSNNIQHVEQVLEQAENILQHLEDKKFVESSNNENVTDLLQKQTESSKESVVVNTTEETAVNKSERLEIEQSKHEFSLNKSIELTVNKAKTASTECTIENLNKDMTREENDALQQLNNECDNNLNLTNDDSNSSTISNSSVKSVVDSKTESKLNSNLSLNNSMISPTISEASSTSFPTRSVQSTGFPRSPKAVTEKLAKSPFLEKSDYLENKETQANFAEPALLVQKDKRCTFSLDTSTAKSTIYQEENNLEFINQTATSFSTDTLSIDKMADETRTFCVKPDGNMSTSVMQFPSMEKVENTRRTFSIIDNENLPTESIDKSDMNSRRTFNLPSEECVPNVTEDTDLNCSFEVLEVDDHNSQHIIPLLRDEDRRSQSPPLSVFQANSQSPPLPTMHRSHSPSLAVIEQESLSPPHPSMQQVSEYPLPVMETSSQSSLPRSQSPSLQTERPRTQSPPLPTTQPTSQSPPISTMQPRSQSPPLPTMQPISQSPPLPTMQTKTQSCTPLVGITPNKSETQAIPLESTGYESIYIKEEIITPPPFESTTSTSFASQPLSAIIQKRPSIRDARARAADILSAKEQSNIKEKDEKDVFVEENSPSPVEDICPAVSTTSTTLTNSSGFTEFGHTSSSMINNGEHQQNIENQFSGNNNLILNPCDFDYLLTKGNNNTPVDRSSLLLKFDPLLGVPVPVNQGQQQLQLQIPTNTNHTYLSPTLEEDEHNHNRSFVIDNKPAGASAKLLKDRSQEVKQQLQLEQQFQQNKKQLTTQGAKKKNATMSVDVIKDMSLDNDCNKAFENSNSTQSDDKQINYKMDELEKKIKNEVLKTEDIEKKLKDAEQREEALIKRITEKDKTIAKMTGVIEAYEKAIAELIADKEQLTQHYESQLGEAKADRDSNYHHLTSLETTFSDLHVKYEKSKEMTCQLKESEEALLADKRKNLENLHLQEQRYDKMKNHAMQQLEIANKKLESLTREHSIEITKLKALLKKEEIARSSINEQLAHKTKENAELVKICDELISGQGSNFSFEPFDPKKH